MGMETGERTSLSGGMLLSLGVLFLIAALRSLTFSTLDFDV